VFAQAEANTFLPFSVLYQNNPEDFGKPGSWRKARTPQHLSYKSTDQKPDHKSLCTVRVNVI